ncbi:tyrosine-type recombinase/integrase [Comamonas thiooxydans]|uniref:tyrosine-type recombinase/integrase n=1 Tax=Comamonas thiooxydans TaxID=363952 RepID=UPI000579E00A|nr:integrase arm-type DNA-binding domain-containing protein [Comamonas thiooxydans]
MGFDAKKAKALAAGEHIIVDDAPGLRLVATATRKTWTYRYKSPIDGRMRQVAMGQWPAMTYAAALGVWDELRTKRDAGEDLAKEKKRAGAVAKAKAHLKEAQGIYTVERLIEDYLQGHVERHRKLKGQKETRRLMLGYSDSLLPMKPEDVKRTHAFALLEKVGANTPVLANNLRTELGAAWDYALDAGRISEETPNWWRLILKGKLRSRGKIVDGEHQGVNLRALQGAEVVALIRFLPNLSSLLDDLFTLYLWTGCRGSELVQMMGQEVTQESDGWWWTIPRGKLKMARNDLATDLRVPLVGRALVLVRRRIAAYGAGHLFPSQPGSALPHVEQKVLGVAAWCSRPGTSGRLGANGKMKLDIEPWAPHDLRRTVRTTLARLGCPDGVAEAVLGHLPSGIVGVYNRHSYDKERRHWLTRLSEHWEHLCMK